MRKREKKDERWVGDMRNIYLIILNDWLSN